MTLRIKIFLAAFLLSLPLWWTANISANALENFFYAQISLPFEETSSLEFPKKIRKERPEFNAKAVFLLKIGPTGREKILIRKTAEKPLAIASLTKLMTGLIVLQDDIKYNFSKILTISKEASEQENVPNYGNLKRGEKLSIKKLLELLLVYSSNDAAYALSEIEGVENFVAKMNQKARDLSLTNTHFVNSTGLDPENLRFDDSTQSYFNYSSAEDLAFLTRYLLKNYPLLFAISLNGGPYEVPNGIREIPAPRQMQLVGGKTGYTDEAGGGMLLVLSDDKGRIFINLILGAPSSKDRVSEMQKIVNWLSS